jgi:hypothetical protein
MLARPCRSGELTSGYKHAIDHWRAFVIDVLLDQRNLGGEPLFRTGLR